MKLRKVEEHDAANIIRWRNANAEYFPSQPPWTRRTFFQWWDQYYCWAVLDNYYIVCRDDNFPVGTIGIKRGEVQRILLGNREEAPPGIMGEALEYMLNIHPAPDYWLRVLGNNYRAQAFYRKHWFEIQSSGQYPTGEPFVVMGRHE